MTLRLEPMTDEQTFQGEHGQQAYSTLIALLQEALYRVQGALKHVTASEGGCTIVAALGLPPFEHAVVACTQGAVRVVMAFRASAHEFGMRTYACVLAGRCWVGATGNE